MKPLKGGRPLSAEFFNEDRIRVMLQPLQLNESLKRRPLAPW